MLCRGISGGEWRSASWMRVQGNATLLSLFFRYAQPRRRIRRSLPPSNPRPEGTNDSCTRWMQGQPPWQPDGD